MKKYIAELIGTFALVFFGTGAIVVDHITHGAISHLGVALSFGLIVTIMIYALGSISGAHINPAVSIGFCFTNRFHKKDLAPYLIAQTTGAIAASFVLFFLFVNHGNLGSTQPSGTIMQSFVLEMILTYFLMLVILCVSQNPEISKFTGIAVGATVMLEALFAGPICGASMNPARSIAPALVSGNLAALWVYILAPIIGAIIATLTWKYFNSKKP
ncbi:MIP/aquaporin family protein [Aureispira anguillae]|uniref:Aquaporin n=1 Tax=Aureispira anguillae TaxID=2864201 RepID=A0A916DNV8_9BACT|nr:aquaporin [Aureispira anguillae]BDS09801.1 aquaporin [Aureispira anguillae]